MNERLVDDVVAMLEETLVLPDAAEVSLAGTPWAESSDQFRAGLLAGQVLGRAVRLKERPSARSLAEQLLEKCGRTTLSRIVAINPETFLMGLRLVVDRLSASVELPEGMDEYVHAFFHEAAALLDSVS